VIPLALSRGDVADFVSALFLVYIVLIFINILLSWLPRIPRSATLRPVLDFVTETTNPYLNLFRRILPPIGGRGMALDISPILAIFVLFIAQALIVSAIK
jgi:YggT family protein